MNRLPLRIPLATQEGSSDLLITAPEKHPCITGLAIDGDRNIWVRRAGLADSESRDVISQNGELLRRVVLVADTTGTGYYPALHISPCGIVATFAVEDDFQRFFAVRLSN